MSVNTEIHKYSPSAPASLQAGTASLHLGKVTYGSVLRQVLGLGLRMRFRKAATFTLRLAAYPLLSLRWYEFLANFAGKHQLGQPHDDIIRKAIPNFFIHKASSAERLRLLQNHFSLAGHLMSADDLQTLWAGEELHCGAVAGKREQYDIALRLSDHSGARHEGCFTVSLNRRSDQMKLCMLSFIFVLLENGAMTVAIGGLQGAYGEDAKRAIIDATRDLYGVRPKDALLLITEGMAGAGGADHFMGVDNANHVINFRNNSRRIRMRADLDSYWTERGGEPAGRFGFLLPLRNAGLSEASAKRDLCKLSFLLTGRFMIVVSKDAPT